MRALALSSLLVLAGAVAGIACSTTVEEDAETSAHDLTDEELARSALKIMGAPQVQQDPGEHGSCAFTGCHSINPITLKQWGEQYKRAMDLLDNAERSNKEKINWFRQNPEDERTGFTPERVGIMSAGAHLALGANVSESRHPEAYKQGQMLSKIFEGQPELYAEFRKEMLMPVLPEFPRLSASQYETVLTWFKKGMPHIKDIIRENRPTKCEDSFDGIRARTIEVKNQNWAATNYSRRLPMLGCPAPNPEQPVSPTACFQQKIDGKDVFPSAVDTEWARSWPLDGSAIRILRELSSPNSFWLRSSADGRFAMTGGGRNGGAQAIDLQANLDGVSRDIGLKASFDPDFWPDNKAFMFQSGLKFCAQSVLEKASTTLIEFNEPECTSLSGAPGLYQTVGQVIGDNSISDRFILFSIWAGDSGQYTATAKDTSPRAGEDSAINIYTAVAQGNDVEEGYQIAGDAFNVATPFRGDTMMGRSGKLIGSRWAYGADADGKTATGYAIEKLDYKVVSGKYRFEMTQVGNVCLPGNKANFSFDERFLSTHHYNEPSDFGANDDPKYLEKGSADIFVIDFITGAKQKVTKMGPGQFALYPHFRSDGWLYFLVVDQNASPAKYMVVASDWAIRSAEKTPTP